MFSDIKFYFRKCGFIGGFFNTGLYAIILYRVGYYLFSSQWRNFNPLWYCYILLFSCFRLITKIEIPCNAKIGKRLFLPHPYGLILGEVEIGDDCTIGSWVVIGHRNKDGCPKIGNNVYIGPKATVLGKIKIGDDSVIGASAFVIKDMKKGAKALAVPSVIRS